MLQRNVVARERHSDILTMCYLTYHCHSVCPMYINFDSALTTYKNITAPSNLYLNTFLNSLK